MTNTTSQSQPTERAEPKATNQTNVLVTGATGLVGRALLKELEGRGFATSRLVRRQPEANDLMWDPAQGILPHGRISSQAVVHLAGENIAEGRWTPAKMEAIRSSRIESTRLLAEGLAGLKNPPSVLVSASAIGFYGNRADEVLTEESSPGAGFLAEVCEEWERATQPAQDAGIRVVNLRIGVVLARDGGALNKMLTPFKLGLGGRMGSGRQWMSWISLTDLVRVICEAVENEGLNGPVNATSPEAVTNLQFTKALGRVLRRPTIAPMPSFAARLVLGKMADALLLASTRVRPNKLLGSGFRFTHPEISSALEDILGDNS